MIRAKTQASCAEDTTSALGREITPATPTPSIRTLYVGVSTPPGPTLKKATGSGSTE